MIKFLPFFFLPVLCDIGTPSCHFHVITRKHQPLEREPPRELQEELA